MKVIFCLNCAQSRQGRKIGNSVENDSETCEANICKANIFGTRRISNMHKYLANVGNNKNQDCGNAPENLDLAVRTDEAQFNEFFSSVYNQSPALDTLIPEVFRRRTLNKEIFHMRVLDCKPLFQILNGKTDSTFKIRISIRKKYTCTFSRPSAI